MGFSECQLKEIGAPVWHFGLAILYKRFKAVLLIVFRWATCSDKPFLVILVPQLKKEKEKPKLTSILSFICA